jgi:Tol biopolymer transport system component
VIGKTLGPYQVVALLGEGGMGEVYRARDTKLNRDVALKILPEAFTTDADRLARFKREAQVLASLNHPNIAAIYGFEDSQSTTHALVMELVTGDDLSALIARGPIPISDVLPIAKQIVDALEAAHDAGIVHRDLKPGNLKVRADGTVKVLDFGLAKAPSGPASGAAVDSPTMTGTRMGMILGTAAYMSPEQARGRSVDKRADIWAFGVVVVEMLTGQRLFKGDDISDVLAAVLRQEVDWAALPSNIPPRLRALLERCLDRDLKTRLRDIGEARVALARVNDPPSDPSLVRPQPDVSRRGSAIRESIAWGLALTATLVAAGFWIARSGGAPAAGAGQSVRLTFVPPDNVVAEAGGALISPDGQKLLFTGRTADGRRTLWLRRLDSLEAAPLPDTDEAIEPFWSPDSKSIAFGAQGKLKRLDLGTARAQVLADAARSNNGAWSPSGVIVFSPDFRQPLARVAATGGVRTVAVPLNDAARESGHRYPHFLPDGRHFLYAANRGPASPLMVGSIDSTETRELLPDFAPAIYAKPGWLIYIRNGTLVAHAFDADRLAFSGEPQAISAAPMGTNWAQGARVSLSDSGTLVIQDATAYDYQLMWYRRDGRSIATFGAMRKVTVAEYPRISPDGKRVVVQRFDPATQNQDLWVGDLARETFDRLTTNPVLEQLAFWSRDGQSVFATTTRDGVNGIYRIPVGGGSDQVIVKGTVFPGDVSPDGKLLFFFQRGVVTRSDIWVQPYSSAAAEPAAGPARAIIDSESDELHAQVSPDGQWLAYMSDITGTNEVYVRRLMADGSVAPDATRVSTGGGVQPLWSRDGREIFFVSAAQGYLSAQLMAVPITKATTSFEFGPAKTLFKMRMLPTQSVIRDYDISLDGQRFLIGTALGDARATPATIILNWTGGLGR